MFSKLLLLHIFLSSVCLSSQRPATSSLSRSWRHQQTVEPLLRFPFANFLANPCGIMAVSPTVDPTQPSWPGILTERPASRLDADGQPSPPPLRNLSTNESMAQQVEDFLEPLADRYLNRNYTSEERFVLAQEFNLVVLESLQLVRSIYPPTALHQCDGIQLQSLPHESLLVSSTGKVQVDEVYRGMMLAAAHMHLMIRDAYDSARFCPTENPAQHQNIRQLTGKMENMMCLILNSAISAEDEDNSSFIQVAQRVLESSVHRYYDCSAREIRGCLVVRYAERILNSLHETMNSTETPALSTTETSIDEPSS